MNTLTQLCQEIKHEQDQLKLTLTTKIEACKTELMNEMDKKLNVLSKELQLNITILTRRIENVETQLKDITDSDNFNPSKTIVVTNLPLEHGKSAHNQASHLVMEGLGLDSDIVRAKRLDGRNGKPGILKCEMQSEEQKILALRRKQYLQTSERYGRVYIRSSQTHEERVTQNNLRLIMEAIPDLRGRYRFAGNGRLVEKGTQRYTNRHVQPEIPQPNDQLSRGHMTQPRASTNSTPQQSQHRTLNGNQQMETNDVPPSTLFNNTVTPRRPVRNMDGSKTT